MSEDGGEHPAPGTGPDFRLSSVEAVDPELGFFLSLTAGGSGVVILDSGVIAASPVPETGLDALAPGTPLRLETERGELEISLDAEGDPIRLTGELIGEREVRRAVVRGRLTDRDRELAVNGHGVIHSTARRSSPRALRRDLTVMLDEGGLLSIATAGPDGSGCHGEEETAAAISHPGGYLEFERVLISTESDPAGRQQRATLELWPASEEVAALHGAGRSLAGATTRRAGVAVNTALFRWSLDGHGGSGRYELTRPDPDEESDE